MRLTRRARAGLAVVGLLMLSAAGVGAAFTWSGVALTAFVIGGLFVTIGAIIGVLPKGSFKEGTIEWPEIDEHPRVEKIEADIEGLRTELATQRANSKEATNLLLDYILAHEPKPEDGMTDEERSEYLESNVNELSKEIDSRYFSGETYDDDIDVKDLEQSRDRGAKDLEREERRQAARARFGLDASGARLPE
jgi:hypothetical protein